MMAAKQMNPLLQKTEAGIEAKIQPENKQAYMRIITAGLKVMFDQKTHQMMLDQLKASDDIVKNVAEGIAGLMAILYKESKEKMPLQAAIPASIVLMTKALDFVERTMGVEITPDLLAQCTQATSEAVLTKFGITPDMVKEAVAKSQRGELPGAEQPAGGQPAQPAATDKPTGGLMNAMGA